MASQLNDAVSQKGYSFRAYLSRRVHVVTDRGAGHMVE